MMQIWINKKNKLLKKSAYGAIDVLELSEVEVDPFVEASGVVGVVGSVGVVGFPDASVDDENNENDSKFGENNASMLVVPPNNDEIIFFIKVYRSTTYYIIIIIKIYFLFIFRILVFHHFLSNLSKTFS